jgi:hypothetical protein
MRYRLGLLFVLMAGMLSLGLSVDVLVNVIMDMRIRVPYRLNMLKDGMQGGGMERLTLVLVLNFRLMRLFNLVLGLEDCAVPKLTGSRRVYAVRRGGFDRLVLRVEDGRRLLMPSVLKILGLLLGFGHVVSLGLACERLCLLRGSFISISCLEVCTVRCARLMRNLGAVVTRERLARKNRSAVPAFGNSVAGYLGDDDRFRRLWSCCGSGLIATLAVLREGLARKNDRLWGWAVELRRLVVGGSVVYTVESGLWREATGNATLVAAPSTATTISVTVAVIAATAIATPVTTIAAAGVLLPGFGRAVGVGDWSGFVGDRTSGGSIDLEGVFVLAIIGTLLG